MAVICTPISQHYTISSTKLITFFFYCLCKKIINLFPSDNIHDKNHVESCEAKEPKITFNLIEKRKTTDTIHHLKTRPHHLHNKTSNK